MLDVVEAPIFITQKTFVFRSDGRFLILLRTATAPSRPLTWDLPGGSLEAGEAPHEGALREIVEETGLKVDRVRPLALEGRRDDDGRYWVTVAYTATVTNTDVQLSYEHEKFRWVTKAEFLACESSTKWRSIALNYL